MCLAIPMEIVERGELGGTAQVRGVQRQVSLMLCPEVKVGEHVLVHAGYAIGVVDAEEAKRTLEILDEVALAEESR